VEVLESDTRVKDTETRVMRVVASALIDLTAQVLGVNLQVAQAPALAASPPPSTPPSASAPSSLNAAIAFTIQDKNGKVAGKVRIVL